MVNSSWIFLFKDFIFEEWSLNNSLSLSISVILWYFWIKVLLLTSVGWAVKTIPIFKFFAKLYILLLLIFLFLNNCSNQNLGSFLKKKNDDMVEKPNLDIDKNISFEDFKNKIINYGKNSSFPILDDWYD